MRHKNVPQRLNRLRKKAEFGTRSSEGIPHGLKARVVFVGFIAKAEALAYLEAKARASFSAACEAAM